MREPVWTQDDIDRAADEAMGWMVETLKLMSPGRTLMRIASAPFARFAYCKPGKSYAELTGPFEDRKEECAHQHVIDAGNGWGRCVDCGDDSFPMASETAELASPSADSWSPSLAHQAPVGAGVMRETCQSCGKPDAPLCWAPERISAFFDGVAKILAAKGGRETE